MNSPFHSVKSSSEMSLQRRGYERHPFLLSLAFLELHLVKFRNAGKNFTWSLGECHPKSRLTGGKVPGRQHVYMSPRWWCVWVVPPWAPWRCACWTRRTGSTGAMNGSIVQQLQRVREKVFGKMLGLEIAGVAGNDLFINSAASEMQS